MMEFIFLNPAGQTLFTRTDMESGHWVQQEMSVNADFPYDPTKVIQRGQRIAFRDPATDNLEVFEIRQVTTLEPDHLQQLTAEHIAVSDLQDEHIDHAEITNKTATQALATVLTGTLWSVGTNTASGTSSADISRGSVWQAVTTIKQNWNVYITPRVVISSAGVITGRYLDISPAAGVWRGVRLSIRKNLLDPSVTYNDEDVLTALYGYGGNVEVTHSGSDDTTQELTFANVSWTATSDHPAKPLGQTYLEWPEKTAIYGRNGRARFGYYQNGDIKDANVLLQKTWEALKRTCEPKISISGTCADLYRMGYKDEPLRLHDLALVEIEETGEVFQKEIIMLDVDLVDPSGNLPEIGDYIPNIVYINRETADKARGGGGGGGRGQTNTEAELSETFAEFEKTNDMIGMVVGTRNGGYYVKAGEIALSINRSGETGQYESTALINADHVNISATSTVHTLAGEMHVDADGKLIIDSAGGMYVERTESGTTAQFGVWDKGNMTGLTVAQLVNGETNAYLNANHVNISGTSTVRLMSDELKVDANGNLIVTASGGLYVQRQEGGITVNLGVYDQGNLTGGIIVNKVNGTTNTYITGDHINISGTSTVHTLAGSMHVDNSGKLIVDSAGGLYVERTESGVSSQFGVWDNGNLTGGVIVQKINGDTTTSISGDKINISGTSTVQLLSGAMEMDSSGNLVIKDGAGLYVQHSSGGSVAKFGVYDSNNLTGGVIVQKINGDTTTYITGDRVNISGTNTVHTLVGSLHVDNSGKLIIDSAGGLYVSRTESGVTSQFGVWDNGNLTGGVIVDKVNGATNTYITGDHINISATNTAQTLAGAMEMDSSGNLVIKDGAGLYVQHTSGGSTAKFGVYDSNNLTGGVIVNKVNGTTNTYITGDHINISGTSTAHTLAGSLEYDSNGRLVVKDAGGLYVRRTDQGVTSEYGVWDNGNLTGGVIVQKINGDTTTSISGDRINISGTSTVQALSGAMELDSSGHLIIKEGAGLYLQRTSGGSTATFGVYDQGNLTGGVIVGQINGQSGTYVKIQANKINLDGYVTTSMLESAFTDAQQINVDQLTINNYLTCLGYNTEWKSQTVVTGIDVSKTTQHRWVYLDSVGTQQTNNTTMVTNVTKSTTTINYLGR